MWILTAGQYAAAITAILILAGIAIKWAIVKPIKTYIDHATYPLQPFANGGKSLPDIAATVNRIEIKLTEVDDRLVAVENHVTKPTTRAKKATN